MEHSHDPFDPQSNYTPPKTDSLFIKFLKDESVKIMPLQSPIVGYGYWNKDGKPVRSPEAFEEVPSDTRIDPKTGSPETIKHFWAFAVWDYDTKKVKVIEITQKGIRDAILAYTRNPDWGRPVLRYSFTIKREDPSTGPVKYTVMANPTNEVAPQIIAAWEDAKMKGFDINRLFIGGDPFSPGTGVEKPAVATFPAPEQTSAPVEAVSAAPAAPAYPPYNGAPGV